MKRLSKVGPLFLNHAPIQARGKDRPGHQVEVPLVIFRGNRFPSRHGNCDLVRSIYAYLRGSPRPLFERVVTNAAFLRLERMAATVPFTEKWTGWDLNPRPLPCQDSDLPADLPAREPPVTKGGYEVLREKRPHFSSGRVAPDLTGGLLRFASRRWNLLSHQDAARPERSDPSEAFPPEHAWRPEPAPLRDRGHSLRHDRERLDDASAVGPDRFERGLERELGHAAPAVPAVDEEACDSPESLRSFWPPHLPVAASGVDPWEFVRAAILAPPDRDVAFVHQDGMRPACSDERRFVPAISPLPGLC